MSIHFIEVKDNQTKMRRLCEVIQHHYQMGDAVLITVANDEVGRYVDELLWRNPKESFLPHMLAQKKVAARVVITQMQENLNQAKVLFNLCKDASPIWRQFQTVYELFDETSPEKKAQSEARKAAYARS